MLSPIIKSWALVYFGKCIGANNINITEDAEQSITATFEENYAKPMTKIIGNENWMSDTSIIMDINRIYSEAKISGVYRVLRKISEYPVIEQKTFPDNLLEAIKQFQEDTTPVAAIFKNGKSFIAYSLNDEVINVEGATILGELSNFKGKLPNVYELCKVPPFSITDYQVQALRNAVQGGIIKESDLAKSNCCVPDFDTGHFVKASVTALDERLPRFYVRNLISNLPKAELSNYETPYHAAYEFAKDHPSEYRSALRMLEEILDRCSEPEEPTPTIAAIDDATVLTYLYDKYGIEADSLDEVVCPSAERLYSTAILDEGLEGMSASEYIEKVNNSRENTPGTGYLDDIIKAYCDKNSVDTQCTIEQLLQFINYDIEIKPKTFKEMCEDFVAEGHTKYTTLKDVIEGTESEVHDEIDICVNFLKTQVETIPAVTIEKIVSAVYGNTEFKELQPIDVIKSLQMPEEIERACTRAIAAGEPVQLPELSHEIGETEIVDELVKHGIPRVTAGNLLKGIAPEEAVQSVLEDACKELGIETVEELKARMRPAELDEPVYNAAHHLLLGARKALLKEDSIPVRGDMVNVFYCLWRAVMVKKNEEGMLPDFFEGYVKECKSVGKNLIQEAHDML